MENSRKTKLDKQAIDDVLERFGIVPLSPTAEHKYSDAIYFAFEQLAESSGIIDPIGIVHEILSGGAPIVIEYVLQRQVFYDVHMYTAFVPPCVLGGQMNAVQFTCHANDDDAVIAHKVEQGIYQLHKPLIDNQLPIMMHARLDRNVFPDPAVIRHLQIDSTYKLRMYLHNVNVEPLPRRVLH